VRALFELPFPELIFARPPSPAHSSPAFHPTEVQISTSSDQDRRLPGDCAYCPELRYQTSVKAES